jgi:hypothetical protein
MHKKTDRLETKVDNKDGELNSQSKTRSDSFDESTKDTTASLKKTDKAVSNHANTFRDLAEIFLSDKNLRKVFQNNQEGIHDWNMFAQDLSHHFICPYNDTSAYCFGYDAALRFETSDQ